MAIMIILLPIFIAKSSVFVGDDGIMMDLAAIGAFTWLPFCPWIVANNLCGSNLLRSIHRTYHCSYVSWFIRRSMIGFMADIWTVNRAYNKIYKHNWATQPCNSHGIIKMLTFFLVVIIL